MRTQDTTQPTDATAVGAYDASASYAAAPCALTPSARVFVGTRLL